MKRAEKQGRRRCVTSVVPPIMVRVVNSDPNHTLGYMDEVAELMRRKKTLRVVQCSGSAKCKLDGRTSVIRTADRMDAFKRQFVLSPGPVSIAKPVPTLP